MEDVVLYYQPGCSDGVSSLLETTEKLLEPFPCRPPPVFTPWFPHAANCHLPIRPARPPPVIRASDFIQETRTQRDLSESGSPLTSTSCSVVGRLQTDRQPPPTRREDRDDLLTSGHRPRPHAKARNHGAAVTELQQNQPQKPEVSVLVDERPHHRPSTETTRKSTPENQQKSKDDVCVSETPNRPHPAPRSDRAERDVVKASPEKHADAPLRRSWNVFAQKGVLLQSPLCLSKQFRRMVSTHRLHVRQRAKWVIGLQNCGTDGDIEQVWRSLNRAVRSSGLPPCNANIQRDQEEIWVFCDLLYSELVGRFLKDELELSGTINLSVHRRENVFSM